MWSKSYTTYVEGISKEAIWKIWADPGLRASWDTDTESCQLVGEFQAGSYLMLKPKGFPKVKLELTEVVLNRKFVDCTRFLGAKMYGIHEMIEENGRLKLVTTMQMSGSLTFLWRKLVAEKIVLTLPEQTSELIQLAREMDRF